jgi:hypothetical protein
MIKIVAQCRASNWPTACDARPDGLPHVAGRKAGWATAWRPDPAAEATRENGARARGAVEAGLTLASGVEEGLTLAAARHEGAEQRRWRRGGGWR